MGVHECIIKIKKVGKTFLEENIVHMPLKMGLIRNKMGKNIHEETPWLELEDVGADKELNCLDY